MAKKHYGFVLILSIIIALGVVSFAFCIASEFKRTKRKDLKLDGKLCFLPGSHAFEYGIAALICLFVAQITGNLIICWNFCSGEKTTGCKAKSPTKAFTFLLLSWSRAVSCWSIGLVHWFAIKLSMKLSVTRLRVEDLESQSCQPAVVPPEEIPFCSSHVFGTLFLLEVKQFLCLCVYLS
ncbi:uncharacterized protein LOC114303911 isoform X2 [Camellia sinensis]|uniref:uncharacterized protein LOC114303911 isoform X2 n=1 Tax=Camellia sinensis TaxID=4442 RepID=UPI0010356D11|nr:uncharacterized protein LOC114303911 isoform X2 [Camellia sinensis]